MTIRIDGTNTAANPGITGTDTDTGLQFGTDEVNIVTGGSTRATVNSSGHLLVGGTTAGNAGTRTVSIGSPGATNGGLQLWSTTSGSSYVQFGDGTGSASDHYRGLVGYEHNNDALIFFTAATERARILSGGGITFNGDTAAANALDDYEEGTWTPTLVSGYASITYSSQHGWYTKVGRLVVVSARIQFSGTANSTLIQMGNMPFTAGNLGGGAYGGGGIPYATVPEITNTSPYVGGNNNYVIFHTLGNGNLINSSFNASSKWISFVVSYSV